MSLRGSVLETPIRSSAPTDAVTISNALGIRQSIVPPTNTPYVRFTPQYPTPVAVTNIVNEAFRSRAMDEVPTDSMFSDMKNTLKAKGGKLIEATKKKGKEVIQAVKVKKNDAKEKTTGLYNYQYSTHLHGQLYSFLVVAKKDDYLHAQPKYSSVPFEVDTATVMSGGMKSAMNVNKKPIDTRNYGTLKGQAEEQAKLMMVAPSKDVALPEGVKTYVGEKRPGRNAAVLGFSEIDNLAEIDAIAKRFSEFKMDLTGDLQEFATISRVPEGVSFSGDHGLQPITAFVMESYVPPPTATFVFPPHNANSGVDYTSQTLSIHDNKDVLDGTINVLFPLKVFGIHINLDTKDTKKTMSVGATILVPRGDRIVSIEEYGIVTSSGTIESALANALVHKNVDLLLLWNVFKFANTAMALQTARFSAQDKETFKVLFGGLDADETVESTSSTYDKTMYDLNDMRIRTTTTGTRPGSTCKDNEKEENYFGPTDGPGPTDRDVMLRAVTTNSDILKHASDEFKTDYDIVLAAVTANGNALQYAGHYLETNYNIVMTAVRQNGNALKYADESLKMDYDIVLAAVTSDGRALQYASDKLKQNTDVIKATVERIIADEGQK